MTWDEGLYVLVGSAGLRNILRRNFASTAWSLEFHPPVMMYVYGIAYGTYVLLVTALRRGLGRISLDSLYEDGVRLFSGQRALFAVRIPSMVMGSLAVVLSYFLTLHLFKSEVVAVSAALFLAFSPGFLAWTSLAMLESGLSFLYVGSLYSLILAVEQSSPIIAAISGIMLGLALGTKETGFGIFLAVLPWSIVLFITEFLKNDSSGVWALGQILFLWVIFGLFTLYGAWPWLWRKPVSQFKRHVQAVSRLPSIPWAGEGFYLARLVESTPIQLSFLYGLGVVEAFFLADRQVHTIILLSWIILPLAFMSLPFVPKRVGAYEITFLLPALSILAAHAVESLGQAVEARLPIFGGLLMPVMISGLVVLLGLQAMTVHPYYMNYRNIIARSRSIGRRGFPIGWWGEGLDLAMRYVDNMAPSNSTVWIYGPRSTAFYHSTRADSKKSLGDEPLFDLRVKAGFEVATDTHFYTWRTGDLKFYFPYYYPGRHDDLDIERLRWNEVTYIVVARWATYDLALLDSGNKRIVSKLIRNYKPEHTVKIKDDEVCWIYNVGNLSRVDDSSVAFRELNPR